MVLLVSSNSDQSTNKVIDWLSYKNIAHQRINGENILSPNSEISFQLGADEIELTIANNINNKNPCITAVWFRRNPSYVLPNFFISSIINKPYHSVTLQNLNNELSNAKIGLFSCIAENAKFLGNFNKFRLNKIETLLAAKNCGIDIPQTLITTQKSDLLQFIKKNGKVITKTIGESYPIEINETEKYINFTEEISPETISSIPENFYCSLFQEKLDKEIEIRTFYLDGKCFSMAIFSQMDAQTSIDFRKYKNNRNVPYRITAELENKIKVLMSKLDLNTGSLDIVKTKNGRFVFLEVNPIGQYDMVSVNCNYHLDRKIAEFLTNSDNE
jgi:ATP-GRASP peptide maturase of grasp-with-spasm system